VSISEFGRFFSSLETRQITGLSDRRLYYWVDQGYLESDHQQPTGSGNRWSFPYIDVLKLDLAATLTSQGFEVAKAFAAVTTLNADRLPFDSSYLATTADQGWVVTTSTKPPPNQLAHITINLETAVRHLNTRIGELNQVTLPF